MYPEPSNRDDRLILLAIALGIVFCMFSAALVAHGTAQCLQRTTLDV